MGEGLRFCQESKHLLENREGPNEKQGGFSDGGEIKLVRQSGRPKGEGQVKWGKIGVPEEEA